MGLRRKFRCPSCDYEAIVSGGPDMGVRSATRTILCTTCRELWDVVTHSKALGNYSSRAAGDLVGRRFPSAVRRASRIPSSPGPQEDRASSVGPAWATACRI